MQACSVIMLLLFFKREIKGLLTCIRNILGLNPDFQEERKFFPAKKGNNIAIQAENDAPADFYIAANVARS